MIAEGGPYFQSNPERERGIRRLSPRWRFLVLRIFARRPEGAATNQPRATPWDCADHPRSSPERARQGDAFVTPFQGFWHVRIPIPRALPWAFLCGPFGANSKTAQHQKARARGLLPESSPALRVGMMAVAVTLCATHELTALEKRSTDPCLKLERITREPGG